MNEAKTGIIGGGVSGLLLARILGRDGARDFRVYESHDPRRRAGSGVLLGPRAIWVFDQLGLGSRLREVSAPVVGARYLDPGLATLFSSRFDRARVANPYLGIHHAELIDILRSPEFENSGNTVYGRRCVAAEALAGDRGRARFADGTCVDFDLLIGADGIRSVVREAIASRSPRDVGQIAIRGTVAGRMTFVPPDEIVEALGTRGRIGFLPIGKDHHAWFAVVAGSRQEDRETIQARLHEALGEFPKAIGEFVDRTPFAEWVMTPLADLWPLPRTRRGGIRLVGDAAHPMTPNLGQGVNQGIWDAWKLGNTLRDGRASHRGASLFEFPRKIEVALIVLASRWIGRFVQGTSIFRISRRNRLLRVLPGRLGEMAFRFLNRGSA